MASSRVASVAVTFALVASALGPPAGAQQAPLHLTRPASLAVPRPPRPLEPWERRTRPVSLALNSLQDRREGGPTTPHSPIVIDLFDGASVTAVFDRFDPNDSGVTWVGHVPAIPGSRVTLVHGSGLLAASITLPDASYTIRPVPRNPASLAVDSESVHILSEINSDGYLPEAAPVISEISAQALAAAELAPMADTAEFIDVMIVYTALAEAWAGNQGGIVNWINLQVSETNSAYAASGVNQRVRLVHTDLVAYVEGDSLGTSLNRLRAGAPGLEGVAALRDAYTADLVSLFVKPVTPDFCGIAGLMTSVSTAFAPSGYSVLHASCGNGVLAHELGHNMGLRHDWYVDAGVTPFSYAHGYVNVEARFRTIMAYPDACTARGIVCPRLLAFSNPDRTHLGQPMGVAGGTSTACRQSNGLLACDADEARALNETALVVANFREFSTLRPPLIRTHPQSQTVASGQALTLEVTAEGLGPFSYQWYRGRTPNLAQPIAGATGPSLTFVPGADGVWLERWAYWVRVSNDIGPASSNTAVITIAPPQADLTAPPRRSFGRDVRGRTSAGIASPRTRLAAPLTGVLSSGWWRLDLGDPEDTCRLAEIEAELAWTALEEHAGDALELSAALERLLRALIVLREPACRRTGGP